MIARMIPMRSSTIFRSRWMALVWAAGVIWFAMEVAVPSATTDKPDDGDQAANMAATQLTPEQEDALNKLAKLGQ
ncbi:MAG: hypothetical protein DI623_10015 [Sphingomonas sanxanigenens]|uniref:Uncharacterized protein n=1 Tax=Sphingomonas sanxanigenens TaxID=397260 RepID=A0A2W5A4I8_9SPHN|nr:MAG: hypothetical protein DI623_10015 [Sphingomonas sanxanigenens]